jgi:hypothetical protein
VDNRALFDIMQNQKFRDFMIFLMEDLSRIYSTNLEGNQFFEGRRSIGLELRGRLKSVSQEYKIDFPELGIFYKGVK